MSISYMLTTEHKLDKIISSEKFIVRAREIAQQLRPCVTPTEKQVQLQAPTPGSSQPPVTLQGIPHPFLSETVTHLHMPTYVQTSHQ